MKKSKKISKSSGWDLAIADAKKHITKLESAIRVFEHNKAAGEPFTGHGTAGTSKESVPA